MKRAICASTYALIRLTILIVLPDTVILVLLADWLSVPPVTFPVQESVPSFSSARGEIVRVPV